MANTTILVVDDEASIRELARVYLAKEGYNVSMAADGRDALAQVQAAPPDLIVLDLMLPAIDGMEVCRRVRAFSDVPILMLTARDDDIDRILGLELGADDYMTKPFNPRVLVARVRAILRRARPELRNSAADRPRQIGDLLVEPAARSVRIAGTLVDLRAREFDLLVTLIDNAGRVLSREELLDMVWGYEYYGQTRTVDVHIAHLRDRLAGSQVQIETVWGKGYKLTPPA